MSGSKYKKVMTRVSKLLHRTANFTSTPKKSHKHKSCPKVPEVPEIEVKVGDQSSSVSVEPIEEKEHSPEPAEEEQDVEPDYSTIKEVTAEVHKSIKTSGSSNEAPPPSPKNIENLYAKVQKKPKKEHGDYGRGTSLEDIPSTSKFLGSEAIREQEQNYDNVSQNVCVKRLQEVEAESVPDIETNVDELQTWNFLVKHQMQHGKQDGQPKSSHPRKVGNAHRVQHHYQKRGTTFKKGVPPTECFLHDSPANFPLPSEKLGRHTYFRSLEDVSFLTASKEDAISKMWQECQNEMMKLKQSMEQVAEENKVLHRQIRSMLQKEAEKEREWKEEKENMLFYKQENHLLTQKNNILLKELSTLHEQKEKEVSHLTYQIHHLQMEQNSLLEKLHSALHERETMQDKYSRMCQKNSETVSYEIHAQVIEENRRLLNDMRKRHEEDMEKILESYRDAEKEKNSLMVQVKVLKDDVTVLQNKNVSLKSSLEEALKTKNLVITQVEQSKQQSLELQNLLTSLLKLAEEATTERDIALTKAEFQEKLQTKMQNTVIEHSIGIGRLQEHIMNVKKRFGQGLSNTEMSFR